MKSLPGVAACEKSAGIGSMWKVCGKRQHVRSLPEVAASEKSAGSGSRCE